MEWHRHTPDLGSQKARSRRPSPRNYRRAFALLEEFREWAMPDEQAKAEALWNQLVEERVAYHTDRLHEAEYQYNKKDNTAKAVWFNNKIL